MADEITIQTSVAVRKNELVFSYDSGRYTIDMSGTGGPTPGYVTIGTSEESIAFGELGTLGWVMMKNLDTANYVRWGFATTVYGGRLEAGETAMFRLNPGATLFLIANTAACKMLIYGLED
jgi:hypothetical protein